MYKRGSRGQEVMEAGVAVDVGSDDEGVVVGNCSALLSAAAGRDSRGFPQSVALLQTLRYMCSSNRDDLIS